MIVSTGVDIVEVYRIRDAITRTPRFAERIFTPTARTYCESRGAASYQSYAARFAAKEAFFKALKTGWRGKLSWHDVEVVNDGNGAPSLAVSNEAGTLMQELGATRIHISLSHTREAAIAQVILEKT